MFVVIFNDQLHGGQVSRQKPVYLTISQKQVQKICIRVNLIVAFHQKKSQKPATKPDSHIDKSAAVNAKKKNVEDPGIQKSPKLSTPKQTQMNIVKSAKSKSSKVSEKIPSNEMDDDLDLPETPIANNHEDQEFFKELRDHQLVALKKQSTPIKRSENSTSKQHSTSKGKVTINNSPKRVQDYDPKEIFQEYDPSVLVHLTPEEQRQKGQYYKEMTNLRLNYPNFSQDEVCIALYRATGYFNIAKKLLDCNLIFELLDDNTKQYVFEPIHDKLLQSGSFGLLLQSKEAIAKRMEFFDLTFTSI
ncbi:hypothetical protein BC833DRAFT_567367 [Globomyces pollinis-pini]|nr:hypothetical protein BC833DRAFT_567367 [Globomyces pollinis-pini]